MTITTSTHHYDAVVVGGRVAGAATALLLARSGLDVLVLDRGRPGSDTLSTHALMRSGVAQLCRWGLLDSIVEQGTPPIHRTVVHYGTDVLPIEVEPDGIVDALYAPRRTVLDPTLVDAAIDAGAHVRHGVTVDGLCRAADGRVAGVTGRDHDGRRFAATAPITVGADGIRSRVAELVAAPVIDRGRGASAFAYAYVADPDGAPDAYEWYFGRSASGGVIPTNGGLSCVWAGTDPDRFRREVRRDVRAGFRTLLGQAAPDVAERLAATPPVGPVRSFPGLPGYVRQAHGPGWALVGDAGYFKDPISAHGISDALRDAELLARSIVAAGDPGAPDALAGYQATRDELSGDLFAAVERFVGFGWTEAELPSVLIELSRAMRAEYDYLTHLDAVPATAG